MLSFICKSALGLMILLLVGAGKMLCAQELRLKNEYNFRNCVEGDDNEFKLEINHFSDATAFEDHSYSLDWGDGSAQLTHVSYEDLNTSHLYKNWGVFQLKVSALSKSTHQRIERIYPVINLSKPAIGFEKGLSGIPCVNSEAEIFVTGFKDNTAHTTYLLDFGDGNSKEYSQEQIVADGGKILHTYRQTHCQLGHPEGITIRVTARNECAFENSMEYPKYVIILPPTADFTYEKNPGCTGKEVVFNNNTEEGLGKDCKPLDLKYEWDFGDSNVGKDQKNVKNPVVIYEEARTYQVTLSVKNSNGFKCASVSKTLPVRIIESVKAGFDVPVTGSCDPLQHLKFTDQSSGDERKYAWSVSPQGVTGGASFDGATDQADALLDFHYGTYQVTQQVSNHCSEDWKDTLIYVRKNPVVTRFDALPDLCPETDILALSKYISYEWYNNQRELEWKIEPGTGWTTELGTNLKSEFPQLRFTAPGKYKLTVTLKGVDCEVVKLTDSREVVVYDPSLNLEKMRADKTGMCEGETITVSGEPEGVIRQVDWGVSRLPAGVVSWMPETAGTVTKLTIPDFGKYRLTATVTGACRDAVKNFDVTVWRAPEASLSSFPALFCPSDKFYPGDYLDLKYNGNEKVEVLWEVFKDGHPTGDVNIIGNTTLTPKVEFSTWGDYEIKVTLTNPTTCGPFEKLVASRILHVVNPQLDLDIQADQGEICVGNLLTFTNHTSAGVDPAYTWSVLPGTEGEDYQFTDGTGRTDEAPRIRFMKSGIYNISGFVKGVCGGQTLPFTLVVKEDPKVVIDSLNPVCPDDPLVLSEETVHYFWNDAWNGEAEDLRRVEWSLIQMPPDADYTPYTSPEWDKKYPKLELKTPGEYILQAKLISAAGCGGVVTATRKITVYDPALHIVIAPKLTDEVKSLGGNRYQALQGKTLKFENTSTGVGLTYHWNVMPEEGREISAPEAEKPEITFQAYGVYQVHVDIVGTCSRDSRDFVIDVRGVPQFEFSALPNRCEHWDDVVDLRDYLHCDSSGSVHIDCNWVVSPDDGGCIPVEGTTWADMFMKLKFNRSGVYTLTLNAKAEYGGVQTVSQSVHVLKRTVTAQAGLSQTTGCTTDGLMVDLENQSVGDSLFYEWKIVPEEGWQGDLTQEHPRVDFLEQGDYRIRLKAGNICESREVEYDFRAFARPEVELLGKSDLGRQCERDYFFTGTDHVGEIRENNDALIYTHWKITPGGATFIHGTEPTDTRPDLSFTGGESYRITGEFANHCRDTVRLIYTIEVDELKEVALTAVDPLCAMSEPVLLQAMPLGGNWKVQEPGMLEEKADKQFYFSPNRNENLVVWATYEYGNGTCLDRDSIRIKIRKLPEVDAGENTGICLNAGKYELVGVQPANLSSWKGPGVVGQKWFDPEETGVGTARLEYWYTDPLTGCPNLDSLFITVHELPDASFQASERQCSGVDSLFVPVELGKGHLFEWDFGNEDTMMTEDAPAAYHYPGIGNFEVVMTAVSVEGCRTSSSRQVKVLNPPPKAFFDLDQIAGCGPLEVTPLLDLTHFEGEFYDLHYWWEFGNGVTTTGLQPEKQTFEARLFDTTYQVHFSVYNVCGRADSVREVVVHSKAVADFVTNPEEGGCTPVDAVLINKSTGSNNRYLWDFGDGSTSAATDTTHRFVTESVTRQFTIRLTAYNKCETAGSVVSRTLQVKPNTILARFVKDREYACAGDLICFENYSVDKDPQNALSHSWDFGDGEFSREWDVCHRYEQPGKYAVTMHVENGCAQRKFTDTVRVEAIPQVHIKGNAPLCEDSELALYLETDQPLKNIVWFFDDDTRSQGGLVAKHAFGEPGIHKIVLHVEGDQIPSCPARDSVEVEVWTKPRVQISPLDTMACSPLEYRPEVVASGYDYFRWDYGDGTETTSEMEHVYRNDSNVILTYHVTAVVENNLGCKEEHQGLVRVYNSPKVALEKSVFYGRPEKVRFINLSRDYTECLWYLPDGSIVNSPDDQELVFDEEATYPLALVAVNQYGCRDSLFEEHRSYEGGLYFPNTFIPHSSNPKVNRFNGVGMGLKDYKLEIFDLYGNKVWETTALTDGMPSEGWDGRNSKGKLLPQGVYVWRAEAVFYSEDVWTGGNNRSGKSQTTQGTVLLLRK